MPLTATTTAQPTIVTTSGTEHSTGSIQAVYTASLTISTAITESDLDGAYPQGSPIVGFDGDLIGLTYYGSYYGQGMVYDFDEGTDTQNILTVLGDPAGAYSYGNIACGKRRELLCHDVARRSSTVRARSSKSCLMATNRPSIPSKDRPTALLHTEESSKSAARSTARASDGGEQRRNALVVECHGRPGAVKVVRLCLERPDPMGSCWASTASSTGRSTRRARAAA